MKFSLISSMSQFVSFSLLPLIVIDNIISYLEKIDLWNIALVHSSFYHPTKKYLYRNLCHYGNHRELVSTTLRREPFLAYYICIFTSYEPSLREFLWSQTPLTPHRLTLEWDPDTEVYYQSFLESIHPQCRIEYLNFSLHS